VHELGFPASFFSQPAVHDLPTETVSFRALSKTKAADRDRALAGGLMALELNEWLERNFGLPTPDLPDLRDHRDNPEGAAIALRTRWGLGDQPITSMVALLEYKGVRVFSLAEDCRDLDAFSFWRGETPFVFLNTLKSSERSRFDAAHELAHLVMHKHGEPVGRVEEREADAFAGALLMPRSSVVTYAPRLPTLPRLIEAKHYWNVSVSALAHRLHDVQMVTEWQYRTLCIQIQNAGIRKSEPQGSVREMSQVFDKILCSLRSEGLAKRDIAAQLAWPLRELNSLIFGLILSAVEGGGEGSNNPSPVNRTVLRLLK
jgi:Zn-dependent peptidase ImmA (M78 family)